MKPKLILCLALVLSGGLIGCSTTNQRLQNSTGQTSSAGTMPKPDSQIWEYQTIQRTDYPGLNKNADFPLKNDSGYGVSWEMTRNILEQQGWRVDTVTISETALGYPPQPIQMATIVLKRAKK
jgi:hypothetical protein